MVPCAFHFKQIQSAFCLDIENGTEFFNQILNTHHCVKCVHIRSYSGLCFPAFALNTERCGVCFVIQSECGKVRTRITPNTDTFYAVHQTVNRIVLTSLYLEFETSKISWYDMKLKL